MSRSPYPAFPTHLGGMDCALEFGHPRDVPVHIFVWTLSGTTAVIVTRADKLPHPLEATDRFGMVTREYPNEETYTVKNWTPPLVWLEPPRLAVGAECYQCQYPIEPGSLGVWGRTRCLGDDDDWDAEEDCPLRCWHDSNAANGYPFTEVRSR